MISAIPSPPLWAAIVVAGITAGSVDVFAAAAINHVSPWIVLQAIAGGLLGKATFAGGAATMIFGLVLQWAMSMVIAAVFLLTARHLQFLSAHPVVAGVLYGPVVYVVMTFVVVPLSRATAKPDLSPGGIAADLTAMIVFGVIVATTPAALVSLRQVTATRAS